MTTSSPKVYVITKRLWFPCYSQLVVVERKSNSYLYSLWIGLSGPILNMPRMAWAFMLRPVMYGVFLMLSFTLTSIAAGIAGRAAGVKIDQKQNKEPVGE